MRNNKAKQIMNSGQLALGAYVALADPQIVEIIGISGFDAVVVKLAGDLIFAFFCGDA